MLVYHVACFNKEGDYFFNRISVVWGLIMGWRTVAGSLVNDSCLARNLISILGGVR